MSGEPEPRARERLWRPEASAEAAAVMRHLMVQPWLVAGRDDDEIAAVKRHLPAITDALLRLGWVLVVERDLVRLVKSPPQRRASWAAVAPSPLQASWFFLLLAGAESVGTRVGLGQLVTSARAAAAEADLRVTNDIAERRAIVRALRMLHDRGVIEHVEGDVEAYVEDDQVPVLIAVHHARLIHVIANYAPGDPVANSAKWLDDIERESDPARRMRRRLIDDTLIYGTDLDDAEADWLRRRFRDDGGPLADAFGLHLERRAEGAAFVVPDAAFRHPRELGPTPFPGSGTVEHAALMMCEIAGRDGRVGSDDVGPGSGWRALDETTVVSELAAAAARITAGRGGWRRELAAHPGQLAKEVCTLLSSLDLVRIERGQDEATTWWFSPATGRWRGGTVIRTVGT